MASQYFFLGNTPDLSLLELTSLYPAQFIPVKEGITRSPTQLPPTLFSLFGGIRKVATELAVVDLADLESELVELITEDSAKNIAITDYVGSLLPPAQVIHIKKTVTQSRPVRFVSLDTHEHELLMLAHQHVSEFNLLSALDKIAIAKTVWIFDAADWVSRDRDKPYRDIKHGMLPPKVARIMVNLATRGKSGLTLADPFCGTGTILAEAMVVGQNVIGGDINPEAVSGAKSNLAWLASTPGFPSCTYHLVLADATHFSEVVKSVDCLASEPYMGPLLDERNPSSFAKIKDIARGLDKLYRGAFKSFFRILPAHGRIVISLPSFHAYNRVIETISIDTLASLGYNVIASVPYAKPGAVVVRNITILEKK